jgi:hypothetical protein
MRRGEGGKELPLYTSNPKTTNLGKKCDSGDVYAVLVWVSNNVECSGFIVFFGARKKTGRWMKKQFRKQKKYFSAFHVVMKIVKLKKFFFQILWTSKKAMRKHVREFSMFQRVCFFRLFGSF